MLDPSLLDELAKCTSPEIADAIEELGDRRRDEGVTAGSSGTLLHVIPELGTMVGYAVTVRITSHGDRLDRATTARDTFSHVLDQPEPRIVVVEDIDDEPGFGAFWGGVSTSVHRALGCQGVVTNGAVRDLPEVRQSGLNILAGALAVSHAYVRVVDVAVPVTVGGMRVAPGDLVHADAHGAVTVPHDIAPRVPDAVRALRVRDAQIVDYCASPEFSVDGLRKVMASVLTQPPRGES